MLFFLVPALVAANHLNGPMQDRLNICQDTQCPGTRDFFNGMENLVVSQWLTNTTYINEVVPAMYPGVLSHIECVCKNCPALVEPIWQPIGRTICQQYGVTFPCQTELDACLAAGNDMSDCHPGNSVWAYKVEYDLSNAAECGMLCRNEAGENKSPCNPEDPIHALQKCLASSRTNAGDQTIPVTLPCSRGENTQGVCEGIPATSCNFVDCRSEPAQECVRRCTPCIASGDGALDTDGESCNTCSTCVPFLQCIAEQDFEGEEAWCRDDPAGHVAAAGTDCEVLTAGGCDKLPEDSTPLVIWHLCPKSCNKCPEFLSVAAGAGAAANAAAAAAAANAAAAAPTDSPSESSKEEEPTAKPTDAPKEAEPTAKPTDAPKEAEPTAKPTDAPKEAEPTAKPTDAPKEAEPTDKPSDAPKAAGDAVANLAACAEKCEASSQTCAGKCGTDTACGMKCVEEGESCVVACSSKAKTNLDYSAASSLASSLTLAIVGFLVLVM